jgi:hypothetical protein
VSANSTLYPNTNLPSQPFNAQGSQRGSLTWRSLSGVLQFSAYTFHCNNGRGGRDVGGGGAASPTLSPTTKLPGQPLNTKGSHGDKSSGGGLFEALRFSAANFGLYTRRGVRDISAGTSVALTPTTTTNLPGQTSTPRGRKEITSLGEHHLGTCTPPQLILVSRFDVARE